jgi:hypothetical protein
MELRVTVGELGFAVGVVATQRRGLELVRKELGVDDDSWARAVLAASSHSLIARQLATRVEGDVRLAPLLHTAAEIVVQSDLVLRCERVTGGRAEGLAFHLAPGGILAHRVEDDVVLRLWYEPRVAGLIDRASAFFELPTSDREPPVPPVNIDRAAMRELGRLGERADVGAELARFGVPRSTGARFAADLASARWKGTITTTRGPGNNAPADVLLALVCGIETWFIDTRNPGHAILSIATRQHLAQVTRAILRSIGPTFPSDRQGCGPPRVTAAGPWAGSTD